MSKPDASSSQQVINIHPAAPAAPAEDKKKKWPWAFTELESEADLYSKEEEEEIKKRLLQKIADAYKAANPSLDNTNLYNDTTKRYLPEVALAVRKELKEKADKKAKDPEPALKSTASTIEEINKALTADNFGNAAVGELLGNFDGTSKQSAKILSNGLAVIKYDDIIEFERHIADARDKKDHVRSMVSRDNQNFTSLASVVELAPPGRPVSYKVIISDRAGVKVQTLTKEAYENLVNDGGYAKGSPDLTEDQKLANRERLVNRIFQEVDQPRVAMDTGMKRFLLKQCENQKLFGFIPVPGILGGRKDRLKGAMAEAGLTFSKKDCVVVEQSRTKSNRFTVTINGEPNEETFIPLCHGCHVKVDKDGKIIPDTIYKLEKNGTRSTIDIRGGIFRRPLTMYGPVVDAFLPDSGEDRDLAKHKASDVMESFKKLELIVCKDANKKHDHLEMSFQALGKTHGLRLTDGEKIATTIAAGLLTVGFGFATAGAAPGAALGVATTLTVLSGASTIQGAVDVVDSDSLEKVAGSSLDKFSPSGKISPDERQMLNARNITSSQRS